MSFCKWNNKVAMMGFPWPSSNEEKHVRLIDFARNIRDPIELCSIFNQMQKSFLRGKYLRKNQQLVSKFWVGSVNQELKMMLWDGCWPTWPTIPWCQNLVSWDWDSKLYLLPTGPLNLLSILILLLSLQPERLCFSTVSLFVGLSGGLHKNYCMYFYKTRVKDGSRPNFWYGSG